MVPGVLLLLGLQGCALFPVTTALWDWDPAPEVVWGQQEADLGVAIGPDPGMAGALAVHAQRVGAEAMPLWSGLGGPRSSWRLVPEAPEDEAAEAMALLTASEGFVVHRASIALQRDYRDGDIVCSDADLRLDAGVDWAVVATPIDERTLPLATQQAPRRARVHDVLDSGEVPALPQLLARCVERLGNLDLTPLLAGAGRAELESWAWIDGNGNAVVDGQQVEALCGMGLDNPALPLAERLARLAALRLLVVVVTPTTRATFTLRPDCVWLCGAMEGNAQGHIVHRSRWHALPAGGSTASELAGLSGFVPGTMRVELFTGGYRNEAYEKFAAKVLGTPFTVATDMLWWLFGGQRGGEKPLPRRSDWR